MAKFYYQGHGSYRFTTNSGVVIYVDPFAGDGYELPADLILVTHQHSDHNQIQLCAKKPECRIITNVEALSNYKHQHFSVLGVEIQAVVASNKNHNPRECVGYILTIDGVKIYASGDTSLIEQMKTFAILSLDYAILPLDGIYNMGLEEGEIAARLIKAKHNIPVHLLPGKLFDLDRAKIWNAPRKLIVLPSQEISL